MVKPLPPPAAWIWWTHAAWGVDGLAHVCSMAAVEGFEQNQEITGENTNLSCLSKNYNNRSPAVNNGSQNGIHCRQRATIIYELTNNMIMNTLVTRLYFKLTIIMLFATISQAKKAAATNKCTSVVGHFNGHANKAVRCQVHRPIKHVQGYSRCHWTPPSGKYLPCIALADAMVINFGVKNWVVALWESLFKASSKKAQNGHSTHVIDAASFVKLRHCTMKVEVGGPVENMSFFQIVHMTKVSTQIHSSISQYDVYKFL